MVQEYGRYFGIPSCVLRGGCLTGENHSGVELHGFLNYLVKCNANEIKYNVFGYKGKQVRDNIHSWDLVNMFWHFHQNPKPGEVYNAGGGRDNSTSILEAIDIINKVIDSLETVITDRGLPIIKGDEGGYVLPYADVVLPLHILKDACVRAGQLDKVKFALDVAASSFYDKDKKKYLINRELKTRDELIEIYQKIIKEFNILSIEDPFYEEDFVSFALLRSKFPDLIVVGDDLTVNPLVFSSMLNPGLNLSHPFLNE